MMTRRDLAAIMALGLIVWISGFLAVRALATTSTPWPPSTVTATAYCLRGGTADGGHGYYGSVAMNGVPFGSRWRIEGTYYTFTVNDRYGHGTQFDIWTSSCRWARDFGRRTLTIRRVP